MEPRTAHVVQRLEAAFGHVAATRMQGLSLLNTVLRVEAVGFDVLPHEPGIALGVLVTPWFMNLLRVPLSDADAAALLLAGRQAPRTIGGHEISFTGGHEPAFGAYEMCSLFSPVFEFADHETARATAREILRSLRAGERPAAAPLPARRGFLFGRSAASGE